MLSTIRSHLPRAALLAALAAAGNAGAQNVQLYGLIDMSAGRYQAPGGDHVWRTDSGAMTTSFIGVKGSDDLGGGIRAKFAIEHFLRADQGAIGRYDGDAFWARDAYVGLSGAFGATVLGRNTTPLFVSTLLFNAFGDSFAFSPSIRLLFTPRLLPFFGDTGWNNSMLFVSPDYDGIRYTVSANLGENSPGATGKNLGVSITYDKGPFAATGVWQRVQNGDGISPTSAFTHVPLGFGKQDTWQLGASYDAGFVKLYGQLMHVRTAAIEDTSTQVWSLGASVPVGAGQVLAQYGHARANVAGTEPLHRIFSMGYDYNLSKRTDIYAVYMNERLSGLPAGNTFAGGMRLRF
jgi:predicted porin